MDLLIILSSQIFCGGDFSSKSDLHQNLSIAHRERMKTATWVVQRLAQAGRGGGAAAAARGGGGRGTPTSKRFYTRGEFPKGMRMLELALKNSEKRCCQSTWGDILDSSAAVSIWARHAISEARLLRGSPGLVDSVSRAHAQLLKQHRPTPPLVELGGARIAFASRPGALLASLYMGVWRAGGIAVPLAPRSKDPPSPEDLSTSARSARETGCEALLVISGGESASVSPRDTQIGGCALVHVHLERDTGMPRPSPEGTNNLYLPKRPPSSSAPAAGGGVPVCVMDPPSGYAVGEAAQIFEGGDAICYDPDNSGGSLSVASFREVMDEGQRVQHVMGLTPKDCLVLPVRPGEEDAVVACMAASLLTGCDLDLVEAGQGREYEAGGEGDGRRRSRRVVSSWPL